jgi:hypothetical protein
MKGKPPGVPFVAIGAAFLAIGVASQPARVHWNWRGLYRDRRSIRGARETGEPAQMRWQR